MVDILERLKAFPISEWKEAAEEITKLRELVASGSANDSATVPPTTIEIETVMYPDGTEVTGTAPLPEVSPKESEYLVTIHSLEDNIHFLKGQVASLTDDLAMTKGEINRRAKQLFDQKLLETIPNVEELPLVVELREALSTMGSTLMAREVEIDDLKANISNLTSANFSSRAIHAEFTTAKAEIVSLQAKLDLVLEASNSLTAEKDKLVVTSTALAEDNRKLMVTNSALMDENSSLKNSILLTPTRFKGIFGRK